MVPPAESTGDTFLDAPVNEQNDRFFGLSHLSFCYDVQASVAVEKGGDELSNVGGPVTYTFVITNDGDIQITRDDVTDSLLGNLDAEASAAGCDTLAPGASCNSASSGWCRRATPTRCPTRSR